MITATSTEVNLTHLTKALGVCREEDTLADLVNGLRTIKPSPASVLVLDEFNACGPDNCNIRLADILMRYIYQQQTGIILYVVTQNKDVAHQLCALNEWQKIGPLQGLTKPSREAVLEGLEPVPSYYDQIQWINGQTEWTLELLTTLVESRHKATNFDKTDNGVITWLRRGMTPKAALGEATQLLVGPTESLQMDDVGVILS